MEEPITKRVMNEIASSNSSLINQKMLPIYIYIDPKKFVCEGSEDRPSPPSSVWKVCFHIKAEVLML